MLRIAVVSDTHGLLRPAVLDRVQGADRILHAGDVGDGDILRQLAEIAPVEAVRGNTDGGPLAAGLPDIVTGEAEGITYRMTHRREDIPRAWLRDSQLVIFGHSHRPELEWRQGCLLLNPGAIGQRRFKLPLTMARVTVYDDRLVPEILAIE